MFSKNFIMAIVYTPPPLSTGGGWRGVELPTKFSKRGALTEPQFWEGVAGKEVGDLLQGSWNFYIKNKLKSEIFNDKKKL